MLRRFGSHVRNQWMGALALFLVIGGGTAYATHEAIDSSDVVDNSLTHLDLKNNLAVTASEVRNFSLNDEDVGQGTFVNFEAGIGEIDPHSCWYGPITGINAQGDHLLLTPSSGTATDSLTYNIRYSGTEAAFLVACNVGTSEVSARTHHFNLLVFDAQ